MTIREWIQSAQARLLGVGIEAPALEAQLLAAHVLLVDRTWLFAHAEEDFPELAGEGLLQRRLAHEPLSYLLGWREFFGRRFLVGSGVLIPRQDTETLVESVLAHCSQSRSDELSILDLCTGSGCIGETLKLELPAAKVVCSDLSDAALRWASLNAEHLNVDVEIVKSDGFQELGDRKFDIIVSNPPYIGVHESLPEEVREFEPSLALFAGDSGLAFYQRIADEARGCISPWGRHFLEEGHTQAARVTELLKSFDWRPVQTVPDLAGIARVVVMEAGEWS